MSEGDQYTKFFHQFYCHRKAKNTIWELIGVDGTKFTYFKELTKEGVKHFGNLFKDPKAHNIKDMMKVVRHFPRLFNESDNYVIGALATLEEVKITLDGFQNLKILGLDGWTVEFFEAFFDLDVEDSKEVLKEAHFSGRTSSMLDVTFIALIPKCSKPSSFNEFRSISLCNVVYKVISKIIVKRLKRGLFEGISKD